MKTLKPTKKNLVEIVDTLRSGGLVIYPTETVYGVGVDATNPSAVKKLIAYKNRPLGKPFSIAVSDINMASIYAELNDVAKDVYEKFLPGPVTVVSNGKHTLAAGIESEIGTIGVRIPDYKLITDIVSRLGKPITATSANASYKKRPYSISDILDNLSEKQKKLIDLIIDAGSLPKNEPSTVIDTTLDDLVTLRQGDIVFGKKNQILSKSEENTQNIAKELWQKYESHKGKRAIVYALKGEMGAGKTIFTKGLAKAMGIADEVTSPTYILEQGYKTGTNELYHFDAWRMESSSNLNELNFSKLINNHSVISIEWADRVADEIKKYDDEAIIIWVEIKYGKSENDRSINWGIEK